MTKTDASKTAVDALTEAAAKAELTRLAAEIGGHDKRYYQEDAPTVSDAEYDVLRRRNEAIEARFPHLVRPNSPSARVGASPTAKFAKVRHAVPMLSLGNAFSAEEVAEFVGRVRRFLKLGPEEAIDFTAEPKIDGLSMSLRYEAGVLVESPPPAATARRARTSPRISGRCAEMPQKLKGRHIPEICEVRGEVYMTKIRFPRAQRAPESGRRSGLRQSAQLRSRIAAPEGPGRHGRSPARLLRLCVGTDERAVRPRPRAA